MRIGLVGVGRIGACHAETLAGLPGVDSVVIADADPPRAQAVAERVGATAVPAVAEIFGSGLDGVVIATPTPSHAPLIEAAAAAGLPVFCEKPVAGDVEATRAVLARVAEAGVSLQVGFQRRFDAGFVALRGAILEGRLGWLHTLRACTADPAPPHADYIPTSGGIFRDCSVHDFDIIRWVTGREITEVYATGSNRGAAFFAEAGDVDTAAALLKLDDGTLVSCSATRYNGAGYDVRLEACGSLGTLVAGLDERAALSAAETGEQNPKAYRTFQERFRDAYVAEISAFCDVVAGRIPSPCTGEEALAALLVAEAAEQSRAAGRPVEVAR